MSSNIGRMRRWYWEKSPWSAFVRAPAFTKWPRVKWSKIDQSFRSFESESLITLISAATDSPACGHRLPSLTVLWLRAATHPPGGIEIAAPDHLGRLLAAARAAAPKLQYLEDCWNADPRLDVRFPVGTDRLRVHPGALSNPVQFLRIVNSIATAIDAYVLDHHGFGLSDLLEVALQCSETEVSRLSVAWPAQRLARDEPDPSGEYLEERANRISHTPAWISQEEMDAAGPTSVNPDDYIRRCSHPDRAAAAWEWSTNVARAIDLSLEPGKHPLGTTLAIRTGDKVHPVPASLILGAVAASTALLASEAASDQRSVEHMDLLTIQRAFEIFGMAPPRSMADEIDGESVEVTTKGDLGLGMLLVPTDQHAYAIGVVSALDGERLERAIGEADKTLSAITVEEIRGGKTPIAPTATIHRLVLYGGPVQLGPPRHAGVAYLHVEDLASITLDAQTYEVGPDLVFQFLDELTTMPGVDELLVVDLDDIWRHWKREGVLNPTGVSGIALALDARQDDSAWLRAASWEPVEAVLTAAGLPPLSEWHTAHLDDRGHATLSTHQLGVCLVSVEPPIVVSVSPADTLVELGVDPSFGVGVGDGLLLTCANFPGVADAFRLASHEPLMIFIEFSSERGPGQTKGEEVFDIRTPIDPRPAIALLLRLDWLELLSRDPYQAHRALGRALLQSLDESGFHPQSSVWDEVRSKFLLGWDTAPPVVMARFEETALTIRHKGQVSLPRSHATAARARRVLATTILEDGISPCELVGREAREFCKTRIVPAVERALSRVVTQWSKEALLRVAEHLNDAHAERVRAETEVAMALSAPWGPSWRSRALEAPDPSQQTRPLELLLEVLLRESPSGPVSPDRFALAEAADLALVAIMIGASLSGAERGLNDLAVIVGDGGICRVLAGPWFERIGSSGEFLRSSPEVDIEAYLLAQRSHQLRFRKFEDRQDTVEVRLGEDRIRVTSPFAPLESIDLPGSLRSADRSMLAEFGTGFDGLMAVLGTAGSWSAGDGVECVSLAALRDAAVEWSSLPAGQIDASLGRLTLSGEALRLDDFRYWELEKRRVRLTTRPLVLAGGDLMIMPWLIHATQGVYLRYLFEGRLPWHSSDIPKAVREAFNDYRQVVNRSLERLADAAVEAVALPHRRNILERDAAALGLQLPGEIDLLVADPARSRLWVCEVKDVSAAFSPTTIRYRIDKFTSSDGFVSDLLVRAAAVKSRPGAAAELVAAPTPTIPWRVIPLMVTREVEPAAFQRGLPVTFTVIDDLASVLISDSDPPPGHFAVGST